jgi:hypothetical protein
LDGVQRRFYDRDRQAALTKAGQWIAEHKDGEHDARLSVTVTAGHCRAEAGE